MASRPVQGARPGETAAPPECHPQSVPISHSRQDVVLCKVNSPKVREGERCSQDQALCLLGTCQAQGSPVGHSAHTVFVMSAALNATWLRVHHGLFEPKKWSGTI